MNTTLVVASIQNKQRGTVVSLYLLARAKSNSMNLGAHYIPDPWNVVVNHVSCLGQVIWTGWSLRPLIVRSVSDLGDSGGRLACIGSEQETTGVLFSFSRSDGLAGECIPSSLGQSRCLHLSPIQSDSHGHQSADDLPVSQNDFDLVMLATSRAASRSAESCSELPEEDPSMANLHQP